MSSAKYTTRIDPLNANSAPFSAGKNRTASAGWTFEDKIVDGQARRTVHHYGTALCAFVLPVDCLTDSRPNWAIEPLSNGWYSVSDASGCAALGRRYGLTFCRVGVKRAEREGVEPSDLGAGWRQMCGNGATVPALGQAFAG